MAGQIQKGFAVNRELLQDVVAHIYALVLICGFFTVVILAVMGTADLTNATVAAFVGTALGYTISRVEHSMRRYFGGTQSPEESK